MRHPTAASTSCFIIRINENVLYSNAEIGARQEFYHFWISRRLKENAFFFAPLTGKPVSVRNENTSRVNKLNDAIAIIRQKQQAYVFLLFRPHYISNRLLLAMDAFGSCKHVFIIILTSFYIYFSH